MRASVRARVRAWPRPVLAAAAAVAAALAVLAAAGITLAVSGRGAGSAGTGTGTGGGEVAAATPPATPAIAGRGACERLVVPAYFSAAYWESAIRAVPPPPDMIVDVNGVGAGSAPVPALRALVRKAQAAGITVLGYSSTVDGQRPAAQVEADVRHYAAWYGVHSIFLDRVSGQPAQLGYYLRLARYIRRAHRGAQVWLNPGVYPDPAYMAAGNVVMTFEGTYAQYLTDQVPSWARRYPPSRFAHTIYATPASAMPAAFALAQRRGAGHIYVTDLVGSNPYQGLPSYWRAEYAQAAATCGSAK
jgi:hypothetical protein